MKTVIAFSLVACSFMLAFVIRGSFKLSTAEPHPAFDPARVLQSGWTVTTNDASAERHIAVPEDLDFAGEPVPWNLRAVRERYAAETRADAYWMIPGLLLDEDRNHLYFECRKILRREGVPVDFVFLFMAESTLRNRVSHRGAAGVCQFMAESAKAFGLEVNGEIDERYHFAKSVTAACQYLRKSYELFGSWTMAAAAYNHGYNGMLRKRAAHPGKSYYEIPLNAETSRYLYRILCIKDAIRKANVSRIPPSTRTRKITVDTTITSLSAFAEAHGADLVDLKKHNPWLVGSRLTIDEGKAYSLVLPVAETASETLLLAEVTIPAAATDTPNIGIIQQRLFRVSAN